MELSHIVWEKHYNFLETVPDRYKCMICHGLQQQPVLVSCCGQHFCRSCLIQWMTISGNKCPHCQVPGITYLVNRQQVRDIGDLLVYCSNKARGCEWVGTVTTLDQHIGANNFSTKQQLCQYQEIPCSKKCRQKITRNYHHYHLANECLCRDYSCEHCGQRGTYHTITGECGECGPCWAHRKGHYSECDRFPIKCPNKCSAIIRKYKMTKHRSSCPLERVECSFSEVGCKEELVRRDLDNHIATSDHHHLLLMMKAFKELGTRTAVLEKEKQELETRVVKLEQAAAATQQQKSRKIRAPVAKVTKEEANNFEDFKPVAAVACCFD